MNKKFVRRFGFVMALMLAFTLVLSGCGGGDKSAQEQAVKIGFFGPLTGDAATDGVHGKNAALLAIKKINDEGGINGAKLELVAEDDQAKPQEALKAVQKLLQVDKVTAIVGGSYSTPTKTVAPTLQESKTPMVVTVAVHPAITEGGNYVFRSIYTGTTQGEAMAKYVAEDAKITKFAVFYDESDYGTSVAKAFTEKIKQLGGEVLLERSYKFGEKDFNPLITAAKEKNIEGLYVVGYYNEAAQISQQARAQGLQAPIFGVDGFDSPKFLELGGTATEGVIFTTSFSTEDTRPVVQEFIKSYQQEYNELPDMLAAQAYDSMMIIAEGLKKSGADKEALREAISKVTLEGVTGQISFMENNEVVKPIVFIKVENGKFTFLKSI